MQRKWRKIRSSLIRKARSLTSDHTITTSSNSTSNNTGTSNKHSLIEAEEVELPLVVMNDIDNESTIVESSSSNRTSPAVMPVSMNSAMKFSIQKKVKTILPSPSLPLAVTSTSTELKSDNYVSNAEQMDVVVSSTIDNNNNSNNSNSYRATIERAQLNNVAANILKQLEAIPPIHSNSSSTSSSNSTMPQLQQQQLLQQVLTLAMEFLMAVDKEKIFARPVTIYIYTETVLFYMIIC